MMQVHREEIGDLDLHAAVQAYRDALTAHAETEGEPAPTALPLVAMIVRQNLEFEIVEPEEPVEPPPVYPTPTLSDWRVALLRMGKFDQVHDAVVAARDAGSLEGRIAWERFEYANHVVRDELLELLPLMAQAGAAFTEADIDRSLRVASGDLGALDDA